MTSNNMNSDEAFDMIMGLPGTSEPTQPITAEESALVLSYLRGEPPEEGKSTRLSPQTTLRMLQAVPDPRYRQGQQQQQGEGTSSRQSYQSHQPSPQHQIPRRSPSPVDPSIKIDPALEVLAAATGVSEPSYDPTPAPFTAYPPMIDDYGALGEMGGKRKKLPHERAGWKEMDDVGPRKRGRKKHVDEPHHGPHQSTLIQPQSAHNSQGHMSGQGSSSQNDGNNAEGGPSHLERDLIEAHRQNGGAAGSGETFRSIGVFSSTPNDSDDNRHQEQSSQNTGEDQNREASQNDGKMSRAEQNRRAQQAFRRRREERMKDLESAAAALEPTQRRLQDAEAKLREVALALDTSRIQAAALKASLKTLADATKESVLTMDGTLCVNSLLARRSGPTSADDMEDAFSLLERQARELAKQNRAKRSEGEGSGMR